MATARKSFETLLLDRSWVSPQDLEKARQRRKPGQELTDVLVDMGALEPQRLARALAQEYQLPFLAQIDEHMVQAELVAKVPINYAKKNRLLPLGSNGDEIRSPLLTLRTTKRWTICTYCSERSSSQSWFQPRLSRRQSIAPMTRQPQPRPRT